ncbi:MAG TPA: hypothetical protein VLI45_04665, partial [Acidobacteriaceae bacterium]|nr:hypothetical protein [Acidobacteriaceae bacterium]
MLAGQPALTSFEAERLASRLRAIDAGVSAVEVSFLYLLQYTGELNLDRLGELLDTSAANSAATSLWIASRVGTQSPWSSKATDILHHTGFSNVHRIERARVVDVTGARNLSVLAPALHDRMTESIFDSADELRLLFQDHHPKSLGSIDVLARGAEAIEAADRELGLSLAPQEI